MKKEILKSQIILTLLLAVMSFNFAKAQALSGSIISQINNSCYGFSDGSVTVQGTGGTGSYTYTLDAINNGSNNVFTNLPAGTMTLTIDDGVNTFSFPVTILPATQITITGLNNQTICSGGFINVCPFISGGTPVYTFTWSGPSGFMNSTSCLTSYSTSGTYSLIVVDGNGCSASTNMNLTISANPIVSVSSVIEPSCGLGNGSIFTSVTSGNSPYSYLWNIGAITPAVSPNAFAGTYSLVVTDINGCRDTLNVNLADSCNMVWPGDADNDLTANNNDILDIGLYYGETGPSRFIQGNTWQATPALEYATLKPNSFTTKHNDCNGNGLVDASDTTAVIANYNFTHPPFRLMQQTQSLTGPPLTLQFTVDSTGSSNTASLNILLGDATTPATNIYGIALTLSIDTTIVKQGTSSIDVTGSWLAAGSPIFLSNAIENYNNREIDIALCRTNHISVSGQGSIGTVSLTMKDDISGRPLSTLEKYLKVEITKYKMIDANGDTSEVTVTNDSIKVAQVVGLNTISNNIQVAIYPNPAKENVTFYSPQNNINKIELYTIDGRIAFEEQNINSSNNKVSISTNTLERGIYFAKVYTAHGIKISRLILN